MVRQNTSNREDSYEQNKGNLRLPRPQGVITGAMVDFYMKLLREQYRAIKRTI